MHQHDNVWENLYVKMTIFFIDFYQMTFPSNINVVWTFMCKLDTFVFEKKNLKWSLSSKSLSVPNNLKYSIEQHSLVYQSINQICGLFLDHRPYQSACLHYSILLYIYTRIYIYTVLLKKFIGKNTLIIIFRSIPLPEIVSLRKPLKLRLGNI